MRSATRPPRGKAKESILEAGAGIVHLKGFHHTGIQEVLDAAGVPKGSFYNHFRSKEDFGLALIDHYADRFAILAGETLADAGLGPLEKIRRLLTGFITLFESLDCGYGCPIGNLAQEMGDLNEPFRKKLKAAVDSMARMYAGLIAEAQAAGEAPAELDAREAAYFLVSSWHGALLRMKVEKSTGPLRNHLTFVVDHVLKV